MNGGEEREGVARVLLRLRNFTYYFDSVYNTILFMVCIYNF